MNRASFIKSLFVVAAAPKIISELDLTTKAVVEHKKVVEGFCGIIPYIQTHGIKVEYNPSNFKLSDLHDMIKKLDENNRNRKFTYA